MGSPEAVVGRVPADPNHERTSSADPEEAEDLLKGRLVLCEERQRPVLGREAEPAVGNRQHDRSSGPHGHGGSCRARRVRFR